jgi:serine/threonine protein kinase
MRSTPHHYTDQLKGTFQYMDPEYLTTNDTTAQYDVYSFGILLLELVNGSSLRISFKKFVEMLSERGYILWMLPQGSGHWRYPTLRGDGTEAVLDERKQLTP